MAADEAQSAAILFYSFIFGQSLLFFDSAQRKRAALIEACADTLTSVGNAAPSRRKLRKSHD